MRDLTPLLAPIAVVLFLVAAYLTPDRAAKLLAVGLALLALALWTR